MTTVIQFLHAAFLHAAMLVILCGIPSLALAQVDTGGTPGVTQNAQRTKTGAATVTIIAMTKVDYPPHEPVEKQAHGNSEDASDAIHRKAPAPAGSKATKRELIPTCAEADSDLGFPSG